MLRGKGIFDTTVHSKFKKASQFSVHNKQLTKRLNAVLIFFLASSNAVEYNQY